jgi:uncharacterized protein (TIRG00374 family)
LFLKYKKKIIYSVVFGAAVFLALSIYANFAELLDAFNSFIWLFFPLVIVLAFCNYISRFLKWNYYTRVLDIKITTKLSFIIFLSSFIMAVTPGKVGEVFKSYLLKEQTGTPVSKSAPIVVAERITDFLSLILLSLIGAVTFHYGLELIITIGLLFVLLIIVVSSKKVSYALINFFEKFKFVSGISHKIHSAYDSIYRMVRPKELIIALLLSVIAWFFECFGFYVVINSFGIANLIHIDIFVATFIYGFATIAGAVTMLPGGLGVTDASIPFLLILLKGIPKNIAVASSLIIRIATLWFAVMVGIVSIIYYQKITQKKLSEIALNT